MTLVISGSSSSAAEVKYDVDCHEICCRYSRSLEDGQTFHSFCDLSERPLKGSAPNFVRTFVAPRRCNLRLSHDFSFTMRLTSPGNKAMDYHEI